jgi:hypothetical protein
MLDNDAKLDKIRAERMDTIDGWVGFDLGKDGTVEAAKDHGSIHVVAAFKPVGPWAKEAERLKIEKEQHALLFSLTDEEGREYDRLRNEN